MPGRSYLCLLAISLLLLTPSFLCAQSTHVQPDFSFPGHIVPPAPPEVGTTPSSGTLGFPEMARAAGTIFSGTVTAIARHPAGIYKAPHALLKTHASDPPGEHQAVETVAITFHVQQAIRGATPGQDLTISQWIGAWSSGQRYRVGERVLLFLYPPSKLGLTSCVSSFMGRFSIDPLGRVLLTAQHLSAFRQDPVLGGKSRATFNDFALAVRRADEGE